MYPDFKRIAARSILLEMKTSGWADVRKWILSFGPDAELIAPDEMRLEIKKNLTDASIFYQ